MKLNGRTPDKFRKELVVIPRPEGDFVFTFKMVTENFPEPAPKPLKKYVKGELVEDVHSERFKNLQEEWGTRRFNWTFLTSISATENLEWETVKMEDPGTWHNWEKELKDSGFNDSEVSAITNGFVRANFLTEKQLEDARSNFQASLQAKAEQDS